MTGYLIIAAGIVLSIGATYWALYIWSSHMYRDWLHDCSGLLDVVVPARRNELPPPARAAMTQEQPAQLASAGWSAPRPA